MTDMWNGAPIADGSRFDAIVVGAGAAGGVAAARLCEAGLNVAIFEAGSAGTPQVNPVTRSLTALARFLDKVGAERRLPPKVARIGERVFRRLGRVRQPVQSGLFAWAMAPDILVDDRDCPYETEPGTRFSTDRASTSWNTVPANSGARTVRSRPRRPGSAAAAPTPSSTTC
ncbi:MAG: hypothetical protein ACU0DM_00230, partial [Paracoccus sp. (in: a-proteobacteria)]